MPEFKRGDIVRHTGKFLRSIGMFAGAPINGRVIGFKKMAGRPWPVVEWSDNDNFNDGLVNPANIELDPRYARQKGRPSPPVHFEGDNRWFKVHYVAGSYAGVREVQAEDGEEAKAKVRAWVRKQMAIPQYYESYRVEELDGLEAAPKRYKRPPRVGTRVRFSPNPASLQLYSSPPEEDEEGEVTTVAGPRGPMSHMRGPGGGLVYVDWDQSGPMGVSLYDIEKA